MSARLVDWSLLVLVMFETVSGVLTFLHGRPQDRWLFSAHGMAGLALAPLLVWKLRRVWPRLVKPRRWDGATVASVMASAMVFCTLGTGLLWTTWQWPLGYPNGLNWHVIFGVALAVGVLVHALLRFKPLRPQDLRGRRTALRALVVAASGGVLWQGHQTSMRAANLPGAARRFTGSREVGSDQGLSFPVTMWMLDNPLPVDLAHWRLHVAGAVRHPMTISSTELSAAPMASLRGTLDCTGGWYTTQTWRGLPVSWLLDLVAPTVAAVSVSFVSVTGYRWSVPLAEARHLLLATHVGEQPLDHGHGAPLRLVAPNRRGFQWVKWVTAVHLLDRPDLRQWGAIFTSGFSH